MRKYLAAIIVGIFPLFVCGVGQSCASDESATTWLTYVDQEFGFMFEYPDYNEISVSNRQDSLIRRIGEMYGEVAYPLENQQRLVVAGSTKPMFTVTVYSNPQELSLRDFADLMLSGCPWAEDEISEARVEVDGHHGIRIDTPGAGGYERVSEVFLSHGDHVYALTLLANSKTNDRFLKNFVFDDR